VLALDRSIPADVAVEAIPVGLISYGLGPDARIVDLAGLADPVGGRLRLQHRGRPGHEKHLGDAWVIARLVDPATPVPPGVAAAAAVDAARRAMTCGDLADIVHAVSDPMTPSRFLQNLGVALRTSGTRVPADPTTAAHAFCPPRR